MKAFVTGATGFIGPHVVGRMASAGHELRCLVRRPEAGRALEERGARVIAGTVLDAGALREGMRGCDWVVNLANVYSFWERDRRVYGQVNIEGTRCVMEAALAANVPKVVHVSSAVVYGRPAEVPFTEGSAVGPVHPSEYARTKYEGDKLAWRLREERGLPLVTVMPGAVLGPGDPKATGRYLRDLVRRRLPARVMEDSVLTFVHVRDVAEAIVRAAEKEGNVGEKYLVGGQRLAFREVNQLVREIAGVAPPPMRLPDSMVMAMARALTWVADRVGRPPAWGLSVDQIRTMKMGFQFDGGKAERELGIVYTPIREALREAIEPFTRG